MQLEKEMQEREAETQEIQQKGWWDKSETATDENLSDDSFSLSGSDISDMEENLEEQVNEDDPQIRRLKWLKPEYHPNYKAEQKKEYFFKSES